MLTEAFFGRFIGLIDRFSTFLQSALAGQCALWVIDPLKPGHPVNARENG